MCVHLSLYCEFNSSEVLIRLSVRTPLVPVYEMSAAPQASQASHVAELGQSKGTTPFLSIVHRMTVGYMRTPFRP